MNDELSKLLVGFEDQLQCLTRRQFLLEAFKDDLDKVSRGERFRIRNGVLWLMLLDTRDALVVHLASWARGVYQPGGLIDRLRTSHARDLPRTRPPGPFDNVASLRASRDVEHADALARLFPGLSEEYPNDSHFDQLRDTFVARMKRVVDDASNRVRPFDRDAQADTVTMHEVPELRDAISYAERFLKDLDMVGCQRSLDYGERNTPKAADVIPDMVDSLVLGTPDQIERVRGNFDRIAFYDELHHRHSTNPNKPQYFNDNLFTFPVVTVGRAQSEPRYVGFFPALPLDKNIELDEWVVGTPPPGTPWVSSRFRELSETLARSFQKLGFKGGAMLWHRDRGFDGSKPSDNLIAAIHAAVAFAVLDANDRLRPIERDNGNKGWDLATTENADLFIQSIDEDGGITHRLGGLLKRTLVAGHKIGGETPPLADAVQPISRPVPASATLARALFDAVRIRNYGPMSAVAVAAEWHRTALANPLAVTMAQRLIALKTGFEALFGESSSAEGARKLRGLFDVTTRPRRYRDLLPWDGLLWTPNERADLWRWFWLPKGERLIERRDEIEDWFKTLALARNDVIHRGSLTTEVFQPPQERPLSRYVGDLLWVGERVLREAIKAKLGPEILLRSAIAHQAWAKATFGQQAKALIKHVRANPPPPPPAEPPPRTLRALLSILNCPAANLVTIGRLVNPGPVVDETGTAYNYVWEASYGAEDSSMMIRNAERDILKQAGAEDELPEALWLGD